MSRITSVSKSYAYDSTRLKTPNFKEIAPAPSPKDRKDAASHPPIVMDEYGQTPDHYYLARKPPTSFFQVKRKLDLQSVSTSNVEISKTIKPRQRKKSIPEKPKGKTVVDKPRYDTSLGQLTKKFLKLLSNATDGVINLNAACTLLSVPKRRLYDITNVLEGAGLIQKTSRNNIQWMGRVSSPCASVVKYDLEKEIDILEAKENKLDELIYYLKSKIDSFKEADAKYHYVTSEDLKSIEEFSQQMLVGVETSPSVQVVESNEKTVLISSQSTEIEAFLLFNELTLERILPKAFFVESSYNIQIRNNMLLNNSEKVENSPLENSSFEIIEDETGDVSYSQACNGTMWTEGDTVIKNAFITEEDDIAPMGKHFLLQTEDQNTDLLPFSLLESTVENYSFSLDDGEGLTDLFDCGFSCP